MFWVKKILDLVHLRRAIALRIDGNDCDATGLGLGFNRLLDLVEEVCLKVGDREAELLNFLGLHRSE